MVLMYPMMFLSGAFFTVDILPAAIQKVSAFMPLTYVVNLLRGLWIGEAWGEHLLDVGVLAGMLVLGIIVSAKTFRWE
jgi:ABC-2 type transport system permease protein